MFWYFSSPSLSMCWWVGICPQELRMQLRDISSRDWAHVSQSQTLTRRTMHNSKERKKNRTLIALIDVQTLAVWMPPTVVLTPRLSVGPGGYLLAATCASCGLGASRCQISFYTADSTRSSDSNPRPGRPRSRLAVHTHPQSAVVLPPLTSCQGGIALHGGPSPSPVHTQTQSHWIYLYLKSRTPDI